MTMFKYISRTFLFFLLVNWILLGCNPIQQVIILPTATPQPTFTPSPAPSLSPTLETTSDTGWVVIQPGLERRLIHIDNDQAEWVESLYLFRLDQNQFRLDVAYHETPQSLEE